MFIQFMISFCYAIEVRGYSSDLGRRVSLACYDMTVTKEGNSEITVQNDKELSLQSIANNFGASFEFGLSSPGASVGGFLSLEAEIFLPTSQRSFIELGLLLI